MKHYWPFFLCSLVPLAFYVLSWHEGLARLEEERRNLADVQARLEQHQEEVKTLPDVLKQARAEAPKIAGESFDYHHGDALLRQEIKRLAAGFPQVELNSSRVQVIPLPFAEPSPTAPSTEAEALEGFGTFQLKYELSGPRPQVMAFLDKVLATRHFVLDKVQLQATGGQVSGEVAILRLPGAPYLKELLHK